MSWGRQFCRFPFRRAIPKWSWEANRRKRLGSSKSLAMREATNERNINLQESLIVREATSERNTDSHESLAIREATSERDGGPERRP
jgi:hypothetical protein